MGKIDACRERLRATADWIPLLLAESGLPGPRANLELMHAVAAEGNAAMFARLIGYDRPEGTAGKPEEFLVVCGLAGLGKLLSEGNRSPLPTLRHYAGHFQWRLREGVVFALQRWGIAAPDHLLAELDSWMTGTFLEQRAAIAAVCEPALLKGLLDTATVFRFLETATTSIATAKDRSTEEFRVLRKALAYCWSVAVAFSPDPSWRSRFDLLGASSNPDVQRIYRENLKKKRLSSAGAARSGSAAHRN